MGPKPALYTEEFIKVYVHKAVYTKTVGPGIRSQTPIFDPGPVPTSGPDWSIPQILQKSFQVLNSVKLKDFSAFVTFLLFLHIWETGTERFLNKGQI